MFEENAPRRVVRSWLSGGRLFFAGGVAFALFAGGVAYATIPDLGTGLIHGCYSSSTGALRVIDPSKGQKCASGQRSLSWNQRGIKGATGPRGPVGPTGPASLASCLPDLSNSPTWAGSAHAFLTVGSTSYPLSNFEVGGIGCTTPTKLLSVAGPSQAAVHAHSLGDLFGSGSLSGQLELFDNTGTPIETFTFTDGRVISFSDNGSLVQITITTGGITRNP